MTQTGPLRGLRVVELVGQGPGPYCGALLADLGADVVCVDRPRPSPSAGLPTSPMLRGKRSVALDLKAPGSVDQVLELTDRSDAFIDPFRPGVCERLGLGPDVAMARNPRLIYGRMTGWGQDGPMADAAGHDINYIALSGALHLLGPAGGAPSFPINLLGDFAGGGMLLALGIACAVIERATSGLGQVIDAAMVDGAAQVLGPIFAAATSGRWGPRGTNHLDGGAHFYNVYRCADGEWISVGAIEPQFYAALLAGLGLEDDGAQHDVGRWSEWKARFTEVFATRTRDEWEANFAGTDACVAPVLHPSEVAAHPHTAARGIAVDVNGSVQAQAAPRFSRTPAAAGIPCHPGSTAISDALAAWS